MEYSLLLVFHECRPLVAVSKNNSDLKTNANASKASLTKQYLACKGLLRK